MFAMVIYNEQLIENFMILMSSLKRKLKKNNMNLAFEFIYNF